MTNEERALTTVDRELVSPLVNATEAKAAWEEYQALTQAILDESDYQELSNKKFKKKSAWRKYMKFYGLDEVEDRTRIECQRDAQGWPIYATAYVVVRSPRGKEWTGYHECHIGERCCPLAWNEACDNEKEWHVHCVANCSGKRHWSHPGDIPATAHTRAKNRAISDAIGAGEVSAEEMEGQKTTESQKKTLPACPKCGKPGRESSPEMGGGYYCWKKKGGCGHTWDKPEKEAEAKPEGKPEANGGPKPGAYPITPIHEKLYGLIEFECQGDMMKMGDMLETLTKWADAKGKEHPGKREVGQISVKQAEWAIQHFKEQFGERSPGQEG